MSTDEVILIVDDTKQLLFNGKEFSEPTKKDLKECYVAHSLDHSSIRYHGFKALKSSSQEKLEIQSEMKMFDEAGLDPEIDFIIAHSVIELDNNNEENYVEVYAVEELELHKKFDHFITQQQNIDFVFPEYLSYTALYEYELLERKNDLFIYFSDEDAYAVIFKAGKYIATSKIDSLQKIAQKANIKPEDIKEVLRNKGVSEDLYTPEEFLMMTNIQEEMSKLVERISHAIGHKRGVFGLEHLDNIYLDFDGSDIPGFLELFSSYGYEETKKGLVDVFKELESSQVHLAINALYALGFFQEKYSAPNLTIFERKPSFFKTHAGQFISLLVLAVFVGAIYPVYALVTLDELTQKEQKLKTKVAEVEKKTSKLQKHLKAQKERRKSLKKDVEHMNSKLNSYVIMLDTLKSFEGNIFQRQQIIKDIDLTMQKYKLSSKNLHYTKDLIVVQIISKNDKRDSIAEFMKELIVKGYTHVHTNEIQKHENYYESYVEIQR
jgi:hypothetical protein